MNQKERQMGLINNDENGKHLSFKEMFEELLKNRPKIITILTNESSFDDLIYY